MRKYLIIVLFLVTVLLLSVYVYFTRSVFIDFRPNAPVAVAFQAEGETISQIDKEGNATPLFLRGVEMTPSTPGYMAWGFGVGKQDYLRWFDYLVAMGANTMYVPDLMDPYFYNALYTFNRGNETPLFFTRISKICSTIFTSVTVC